MDPVAEQFSNLQVDVASLPRVEEVRMNRLCPKYLYKLHIRSFLSFLVPGGALFAASFYYAPLAQFIWIGEGILLLFFGWSLYLNLQLLRYIAYGLRERDLIFKRGYLFRKTTVVPFNRVQHISVQRALLDKALGISTLKIFTAGGAGSDLEIPGLFPENASRLKDEISARTSGYG